MDVAFNIAAGDFPPPRQLDRSVPAATIAETGEELSAFFDDWLLGETTPPRE